MSFLKISIIYLVFLLSGCASYVCEDKKGEALKGTESVLVGLYVDQNGYPQSQFKTVRVFPGQKIIFAGPDKFDILFKDRSSPVGKLELPSENGILVIEIPRDIFDKEQKAAKNDKRINELRYNYGIRVDGRVTDPEIIVTRR
jgi:hypothetical protein